MERAHVLVRLRDGDAAAGAAACVSRTSATTLRLEHSEMSPGVASITFEQVLDQQHSTKELFESLRAAVARVTAGYAVTVVTTGAARGGKSFTMHGTLRSPDANHATPGLVELAIRHVFARLQGDDDCQVLLTAAFTDERANGTELTDAFSVRTMQREPVETSVDAHFLAHAVRVVDEEEALSAYHGALERARCNQPDGELARDFVCVLFVERYIDGVVRRGRLACVDIHGNSMVEPTGPSGTATAAVPTKPSLFADTQFPVHEALALWCGSWLGHESITFMIVAIQKCARKQQQAIQSLLYACKAKDIKSNPAIHEVDTFSECADFESAVNWGVAKESRVEENDPEPPMSPTTSSLTGRSLSGRFTKQSRPSASALLSERLREAYRTVKKASATPVPVFEPASPFNPHEMPHKLATVSNGEMEQLHSRANAILSTSSNNIVTLSLVEKFDMIQAQFAEMEKAVQHEASVKQKCVERISKLSQTMSFQVVEHEKAMQEKETENSELRRRLQDMQSKYDEAEKTLQTLQEQVEAVKLATKERNVKSPVKSSNERGLLQQFASRLETAMQEAKSVVDHKDSVIKDMEMQLEQLRIFNDASEKRYTEEHNCWVEEKNAQVEETRRLHAERDTLYAENATLKRDLESKIQQDSTWHQEQQRWEREKEDYRRNMQEEHARREQLEVECNELKLRHGKESAAWKKEKAKMEAEVSRHQEDAYSARKRVEDMEKESVRLREEWDAKMKGLRQEIENERLAELGEHERELIRVKSTVANLEARSQSQEDEVTREHLKSVAAEAARLALERQVGELEEEFHQVRTRLIKEKKKLDKKLRTLIAERKEQMEDAERLEDEMAQEVQRLGLEIEAVRNERLQLQQLYEEAQQRVLLAEERLVVSQEQTAVLEHCVQQLEAAKQSLEREMDARFYAAEQEAARRTVEKEAQLSSEYEQKLRDAMERHSAELLQRDLELNRLRSRRRAPVSAPLPAFSSSSSSSSLSSNSSLGDRMAPQQHDLDQLDVIVDAARGLKHKEKDRKRLEDKLTKQKQKVKELTRQIESLTHALAVANEQETLAKDALEQQRGQYDHMLVALDELQTQVNRLKQENWSLSLALQVTEHRRRLEYMPTQIES